MEKADPNYLRLLTTEELRGLATEAGMCERIRAELSRRHQRKGQPETAAAPAVSAKNSQMGTATLVPGRRVGRAISQPRFPGNKHSGSLTIVKFSHKDSQGHNIWLALCDCQKYHVDSRLFPVRQDHVLSGRVTSCGCRRMRLMRGNQRARKQSGQNSPARIHQQHENKPLTGNTAKLNLVVAGKTSCSPPACEHGFKLIKLDFARGDGKARYCELCGHMNDAPAAGSPNWAARLKHENLAMTRGMAPSTDSPTSPKARKFSKTADKFWAAGKNILTGALGSTELGIVDGVQQTEKRIGGRKRSAAGLDRIRPWQNPNVDFDGTADIADSRFASHHEPGNRDLDHTGIDRRVAKKPEDLLNKQTFGLDDCYGDRDEKALFKYELGEKAIDEDAAEAIPDDGKDLKGDDSDKPSCDD